MVLAIMAGAWLDPDRPLRQIKAALRRGEPVTLVGETGGPRWSCWRSGQEDSMVHASPAAAVTIHSWTQGLLELLGDPQMEHYRVRARVRHLRSLGAQVGLYFTHGLHSTSAGRVHAFGQLTLTESVNPKAQCKMASVALIPHYLCQLNAGSDWDYLASGISTQYPVPAGFDAAAWHDLAIEVSPHGVRGSWNGKDMGWVGEDQMVAPPPRLAQNNILDPTACILAQELSLKFSARGSLGLYVQRGSASFSQVVVEPLPSTD
jgi:serine/threonine-protein kinase